MMKKYRSYLLLTLKICLSLFLFIIPFIISTYEISGTIDLLWKNNNFYISLSNTKQIAFVSRTDDIISDICYLVALLILHRSIKPERLSLTNKVLLFVTALGIADIIGQLIGLGILILK